MDLQNLHMCYIRYTILFKKMFNGDQVGKLNKTGPRPIFKKFADRDNNCEKICKNYVLYVRSVQHSAVFH